MKSIDTFSWAEPVDHMQGYMGKGKTPSNSKSMVSELGSGHITLQ